MVTDRPRLLALSTKDEWLFDIPPPGMFSATTSKNRHLSEDRLLFFLLHVRSLIPVSDRSFHVDGLYCLIIPSAFLDHLGRERGFHSKLLLLAMWFIFLSAVEALV